MVTGGDTDRFGMILGYFLDLIELYSLGWVPNQINYGVQIDHQTELTMVGQFQTSPG